MINKFINKRKNLLINTDSISDLCHLAEIGKISSGLFHDLLTPLTSLTLGLESLSSYKINQHKELLKEIKKSSNRMGQFIDLMKEYIDRNESKNIFEIREEIKKTIQLITYKSYLKKVSIVFLQRDNIKIMGSPLKFQQLILNLISNAIDSYDNYDNSDVKNKRVVVEAFKYKNYILINIKDFGCGIDYVTHKKIFNPLFSTKERGHGLGLHNASQIIKNEFKGKIKVKSELNKGSLFSIKIPTKNTTNRFSILPSRLH